MGIFDKLLGKKKKDVDLGDQLLNLIDEAGLELEVGVGDEPKDLNEDDYKYNHCFIFFGINEQAFKAIENEVQEFDGPRLLSLLRSMDGVFMTDICVASAGSEKVKENLEADDVNEDDPEEKIAEQYIANATKLKDYVDSRFDFYIDYIKENFDSRISRECLDLLAVEKNYIVENIRYGMERWANSDSFEKEDFIGAMIVFVKSSKEFDRNDSISENQDGMNLPVTTRDGFIRDCIFATEELLRVKYTADAPAFEEDFDHIGEFLYNYDEAIFLDGDNPINKLTYNEGNYYGGYGKDFPFGFSYFDQDGCLWLLEDVGKAVTLKHQYIEDDVGYYVSH